MPVYAQSTGQTIRPIYDFIQVFVAVGKHEPGKRARGKHCQSLNPNARSGVSVVQLGWVLAPASLPQGCRAADT